MNEPKFNSQICTTKIQSQRLLDLGLKPETADCHFEGRKNIHEEWDVLAIGGCIHYNEFPAWSLHRLMLICAEYYLSLHLNIKNIRLYDHIIDIIENLIKLEKIDKKYLQ